MLPSRSSGPSKQPKNRTGASDKLSGTTSDAKTGEDDECPLALGSHLESPNRQPTAPPSLPTPPKGAAIVSSR